MGAIMTNLLYFSVSLILVGLVGRALSRSGRAFLHEQFGGQDGVAEAVNRLLVVAFYLLALGFIALTMPVWAHVGSAGQALQLLSGKLGELLLVLGALHLASTVVFARLRRARSWPAPAGSPGPSTTAATPGAGAGAGAGAGVGGPRDLDKDPAGSAATTTTTATVAAAPLWRPRPPRVVH
jgi:hypothetical protein